MRFQLSGLREGLDAAWIIADIRSFPSMCSHVGLKEKFREIIHFFVNLITTKNEMAIFPSKRRNIVTSNFSVKLRFTMHCSIANNRFHEKLRIFVRKFSPVTIFHGEKCDYKHDI